ncbi:hypothetical protein [Thalassobius sp. Cn5-15]|uniref:hypothetical protein n=1 Tax=Thalassobius sp. Cn5-15 TaxID=2917763 RepID=UPI001EF3D37A|nr:hypothetical protein [Thalassobius sp. Cn5-15]MCG7492992.1 hypothetical protein [Thalassobius sp. Cn5-15]
MRVLVLLMLLPTAAFAYHGGEPAWDQVTDLPIAELALSQPVAAAVAVTPQHGAVCLLPDVEGQNSAPANSVSTYAICLVK